MLYASVYSRVAVSGYTVCGDHISGTHEHACIRTCMYILGIVRLPSPLRFCILPNEPRELNTITMIRLLTFAVCTVDVAALYMDYFNKIGLFDVLEESTMFPGACEYLDHLYEHACFQAWQSCRLGIR